MDLLLQAPQVSTVIESLPTKLEGQRADIEKKGGILHERNHFHWNSGF